MFFVDTSGDTFSYINSCYNVCVQTILTGDLLLKGVSWNRKCFSRWVSEVFKICCVRVSVLYPKIDFFFFFGQNLKLTCRRKNVHNNMIDCRVQGWWGDTSFCIHFLCTFFLSMALLHPFFWVWHYYTSRTSYARWKLSTNSIGIPTSNYQTAKITIVIINYSLLRLC